MKSSRNVAGETLSTFYDLIDLIGKMPGITVGHRSISVLWGFVHGYWTALDPNDPFLKVSPLFGDFHDWIAQRLGYRESTTGWRNMLLETMGDETAAFERFFVEFTEFRRSAPFGPGVETKVDR